MITFVQPSICNPLHPSPRVSIYVYRIYTYGLHAITQNGAFSAGAFSALVRLREMNSIGVGLRDPSSGFVGQSDHLHSGQSRPETNVKLANKPILTISECDTVGLICLWLIFFTALNLNPYSHLHDLAQHSR